MPVTYDNLKKNLNKSSIPPTAELLFILDRAKSFST